MRGGAIAALLCLEAVGLFAVPELSAPRAQRVDLAPVRFLRAHLGESRFFTLGPIQPNYGSYFGLGSLNVDDFPPRAYATYVRRRLDPNVDPGLLVGTYGGWRPLGAPSPGATLLGHLGGLRDAAARYVLTSAGWRLPESRSTLRLVLRTPTTWIYRLAGASSYFTASGCRVTSQARDDAEVSCPRAAVLVRRETWFAGWRATLDGRTVPIGRTGAGGLFQTVSVPAGAHTVRFTYAPPGIGWAGGASLAACALMLAPTLRRRVRHAGRS